MGTVAVLRSIPNALNALDRLEVEIKNADSFDKINDIARRAAAVQKTFGDVKEVSDRAGEVWVAAEIRLGEENAKLGKATGAIGGGKRSSLRGAIIAPRSEIPTLAERGLPGDAGKKRAARAAKLAATPKSKLKEVTKKLKDKGKGVTPNAVLQELRQETKATKKHEVASAAFSADGPYDVVVIDPPWPMQKIDRDERPNQDAFDYPVMQEDELRTWWLANMADKLKPDCHLFCWTTQKFLPMSLRLVEQWGFRYVLLMVWHKPGGFQPIGLPQYNCEFAVYARKGAPMFIDTKNFNCCFHGERRDHSRKPDEFYDTIRRVTGGSRIDVFSREPREGFAQYGNETLKFAETG